MSDDMSNMVNNLKNMMNSPDMPDNIKSMMQNLSSNTTNSSEKDGHNSTIDNQPTTESSTNAINPDMINNIMKMFQSSNQNSTTSEPSSSSPLGNIDMGTLMKMKSIIDKMNSNQNDPRSNLLLSLKPYMRESRKDKVEQYIKFLNMGKVIEILGPIGGEKSK